LLSLVDFNLSGIGPATILDAKLSLYFNPNYWDPMHSQLSGSNECTLTRIVDPWEEYDVTWNNRPGFSTVNTVTLPASTSANQDYLNIDVTDLVQDMIDLPTSSHGFLMKMLTPTHYRRLVFSSSDHPDSARHPKLEITYMSTVGVDEHNKPLGLYLTPNPAAEFVRVAWNKGLSATISIYDMQGRLVLSEDVLAAQATLDISRVVSGSYLVEVLSGGVRGTKRLVVE
jgi:hypothetical protein